MHRLFFKIFVWFWAAMIVIGLAVAWATAWLSARDEPPPALVQAQQTFRANAEAAQRVLETGGVEALRLWRADDAHLRHLRLFVIGPDGMDVFGQALPPRLHRRMERGRMAPPPEPGPGLASNRFIVRVVVDPAGRPFRVVGVFNPPGPLLLLLDPFRIAVALLASGLVCLGLAAYLVAPVGRVRAAVRRIADGDLNSRVVPALGGRRDEIADLARDVDRMAVRVQDSMLAQQQLLRDVSHELRSPLARMQVALELARQKSADSAAPELDRIGREADQLNALIGEVLSLARLDGGAAGNLTGTVDLSGLVEMVVNDARYEAQARQCEVNAAAAPGSLVRGDGELLHRAVENVVRNAVRHAPAGSTVEVSLEGGPACLLRVRDRGPGVPEAQLETIFEPFARVSSARERGSGGYGLGLTIARRAIELHGGRISARNAQGGGLEVTIELPGSRET